MRRHMLLALLALFCAGPALAEETAKPATPRETCIESRDINGWTSENDRVLTVTLGAKQRYRVELSPSASVFNVGSRSDLAFIPRSDGKLCGGWGHVGMEGRRILILSITRLADPPPKGEKPAEPEK
ncbi:hypothetical protein [Niveispirillum sp.]|uniref:hypothetical protein n=1 Tax=Niveispirillum sp. TaxID=1917217 RepID=UPI001B503810|nr:hypothetical protein [Niveispirillum sp.]MBP7336198.1 hypothetical protein [Niveispirillum sp.]